MPVYEAHCPKCGKYHEYFQSVANCYDTPECCGEKTVKSIFSAPVGYCENIHYQSPIDGRAITTKQARIEDMKRNGCRPWEGLEQEKKEAQRRAAYDEEKSDKALEKCIGETLSNLAPEKKAELGVV